MDHEFMGVIEEVGRAVRVPFADYLCERVASTMTDHDALFLGDIMSTAYFCARERWHPSGRHRRRVRRRSGGTPRDAVGTALRPRPGVRGGPPELSPGARAEFGAEPVNLDKGDPAEQLRGLTARRGPDVVLECVGHETPFTQAILKDLSLEMGICNARNDITPLRPLVERRKLQPARIITRTMPLPDTPHGDAIFDRKEDRAINVMLKP